MGNFHRFVDPAYYLFGGENFPGGSPGTIGGHAYYRANVISGGVGASGSANAEIQKGSGPNVGTFWVAFNEDGTSGNTNRGLKALTENTDIIDDVLRTSTPKWERSLITNPATNYYQVAGDVFVGDNSIQPSSLVGITDGSGRQVYNGLSPVVVTAIDDGTPGNNVIGTGWATNPTLRFSSAINQDFWLTWGTRSSIARTVEQEREAIWQGLLNLHTWAVGGNSHILFGLDERYRRSTNISSTYHPTDTPGSGAVITRDGRALQLDPVEGDWVATLQPDPHLALYRTGVLTPTTYTAHANNYGGDIGYLFITSRRFTATDAGELTQRGAPLAGFAVFNPKSITSSTIAGQIAYTRIQKGAAATLSSATQLTLTGADYFRSGGKTSLYLGLDVLVVIFPGGTKQAYRIVSIDSDKVVTLRTLGRATPSFSVGASVTVEWQQVMFIAGSSDRNYIDGYYGSFGYYGPTDLSSATYPSKAAYRPPEFIAGSLDGPEAFCARYGVHDPNTGYPELLLGVEANGAVESYYGAFKGAFAERSGAVASSSTSRTLTLNPAFPWGSTPSGFSGEGFGLFCYECTAALSTAVALTINFTGSLVEGTHVSFMLKNTNGANITITWDSNFVFSGVDGVAPPDAGSIVKWEGIIGLGKVYMTRTDY